MQFPRFENIAAMLIEGMQAAVAISDSRISEQDFAKEVGQLILDDLHENDASYNYTWTDEQCPELSKVLAENKPIPPESILKLAAPGLLALSADSGDQLKNIAFQYCMKAVLNLSGAKK